MRDMSTHFKARRVAGTVAAAVLLAATTAMIPRPEAAVTRMPAVAQGTIHANGRATGRIRITAEADSSAYQVYSTGGAFASRGGAPRVRADTVAGEVTKWSAGAIFDIDVTDGDVDIVSTGSADLHVEAAMSGASPALWLSSTSKHIAIKRGGGGISQVR